MSQKNQLFAFVSGEVSPEFYGRRDLTKFPLSLATCENFFVDYRGGLVNRPGTQFIAMLAPQPHILVTFSTLQYDLCLLFLESWMYVLRDGAFVLVSGGSVSGTADASGTVTAPNSFADGDLVFVEVDGRTGIYSVSGSSGSAFTLHDAANKPPVGAVEVTGCYKLSHPYTTAELDKLRFFQEGASLILTVATSPPRELTYSADDSWNLSTITAEVPNSPGQPTLTVPSGGNYESSYVVTAVIGGVETKPSVATKASGYNEPADNPTESIKIEWTGVTGAEDYYIYRSLHYPTGRLPSAPEYGYLGRTTGLDFTDRNVTPDFTKSPPNYKTYWGAGNYPSVYGRFQQRGFFSGFPQDPLAVVASVPGRRTLYTVNSPPIATDAFKYELDSQTGRPIHSLLPLRYGLLVFDQQGITQLKGAGMGDPISATEATAEVQSYTTVAPIQPIAINLDVLYTTEANTEVNAMVYTEYTNSFKSQNILILSSHLFGEGRAVEQITWLPEPHKVVAFSREDGQLIYLTYESTQDVYGWARLRTAGRFVKHTMVRENKTCLLYHTVERNLLGAEVMTIERDVPRKERGYDRNWFVDCGAELPLTRPAYTARAEKIVGDPQGAWAFVAEGGLTASPDDVLYIGEGMFRVESVVGQTARLIPMAVDEEDRYYTVASFRAGKGEWGFGPRNNRATGLWWLDGQKVSVQADGDFWTDLTVTNDEVSFDGQAARVLAGLPYECVAETLPLGLADTMLDGAPIALRGVALRQLNTRGLAVGNSYQEVEVLPSRQVEPWDTPLSRQSGIFVLPWLGRGKWAVEQRLTFVQRYPAPTSILGLVFNIDPGDD